ncbi:VirK family protein [Gynuella sp.]|uniref:VirK family protein n=1 Tax=Gynuella sp. TaxID=2969146 RepID=UPI003D0C3C29
MNISKNLQMAFVAALCSTATTAIAETAQTWDDILPYSRSLKTTESLVHALDNGAIVNASVDLSVCTRQDGGAASQTKGGLTVSPYRLQADGTLSFSDSHFTVSTRSGSPMPIMQFLRYTVAPQGAITVTSFIFSVPDYRLTSEVSFDCAINDGVSFHAAY